MKVMLGRVEKVTKGRNERFARKSCKGNKGNE